MLLIERLPGQRDGRLHNVSGLVSLAFLLQLLPSALAPSWVFQDRSTVLSLGDVLVAVVSASL